MLFLAEKGVISPAATATPTITPIPPLTSTPTPGLKNALATLYENHLATGTAVGATKEANQAVIQTWVAGAP